MQFGRGPCVSIQALEGKLGSFDGTNLIIDSSVAAALEGCSNPADCAVAELFLESTLLHEFTHYGDAQDGTDYPGEEGFLFEEAVYGQRINSLDDARNVLGRRR